MRTDRPAVEGGALRGATLEGLLRVVGRLREFQRGESSGAPWPRSGGDAGPCERLVSLADEELARVDPLVMNLSVARGVPGLEGLDVASYQRMRDGWAEEVRARLAGAEKEFRRSPGDWNGDPRFFRLVVLCQYVDEELGVRYREDHKNRESRPRLALPRRVPPWLGDLAPTPLSYADPVTLFLHGVMDGRRGTCANMAALLVALAWRLGWPLRLACAGPHLLGRYDDGEVRYNVEATDTGRGGLSSPGDDYYLSRGGFGPDDVRRGSDLTALAPRQTLGVFVGLRARCFRDRGQPGRALADYRLASGLFPESRYLAGKCLELGRPGPWEAGRSCSGITTHQGARPRPGGMRHELSQQ
jgi:hypothetical protein